MATITNFKNSSYTDKVSNNKSNTNKKVAKKDNLSLLYIPESLANSIEQTELQIYFSKIDDVNQYNIIIKRLQNIVKNLEQKVEQIMENKTI